MTIAINEPTCLDPGAIQEATPAEAPRSISLASEKLASRGIAYLSARYGLSILINLGNMLVLTWWIGPHAYGIFVTAVGLTTFLSSLTRFGVDTYLVRCDPAPNQRQYDVGFTLVLVFSLALLALGVSATPLLARWFAETEFVAPYLVLLLTIPLIGLAGPPMAMLERELNYRVVTAIELGGQLVSFITALILAFFGRGVWAPVTGFVLWQAAAFISVCAYTRFRPRLQFDRTAARAMITFGFGFSASVRTWQLRTLVNPLLVGRFAGPEGVAFVGLAIRIAESLSFVRTAAGRFAIAGLAHLQHDRKKFERSLGNALLMQVATLGPLLCGFAIVGPWIVPRLLGVRWVPALEIYPFVAAGVLINSVFNLQASALFVLGNSGPSCGLMQPTSGCLPPAVHFWCHVSALSDTAGQNYWRALDIC